LLPGALSAESFEGTMTMTVTPSSGKSVAINFSAKNGMMRQDIPNGKGGSASIIYDTKNQQMIILIPQMQKYMVQSIAPQQAAAGQYTGAGMPAPSNVSSSEGSGYSCEKYLAKSPKESAEIWVTDQLGTFMGFFHGGGPGGRGGPPSGDWEEMIKGKGGFFPMKVVAHGAKGTTTVVVSNVDKTSLPDSLFAPPEGWQKFDMGGMLGGGGFPGAHP
jgi:hypothetical protein